MEQTEESADFGSLDGQRLRLAARGAARRFKNTWVEFGAVLIQVRDRGAWREWGFDSFESYCAKELHIRQKTAQKLTASYGFLQRHEPEMAASECRIPSASKSGEWDGGRPADGGADADVWNGSGDEGDGAGTHRRMPAFETISVLAGAEERGQLSDEDYASLRERIWGEEASSASLAREVKERFAPPRPPKPVDFQIRRYAQVARKLADGLAQMTGVPDDVKAHGEVLAKELEEMVEAAREEERGGVGMAG